MVSIDVDLNLRDLKEDIKRIRREIESLDDEVDIDLNLDDLLDGDFEILEDFEGATIDMDDDVKRLLNNDLSISKPEDVDRDKDPPPDQSLLDRLQNFEIGVDTKSLPDSIDVDTENLPDEIKVDTENLPDEIKVDDESITDSIDLDLDDDDRDILNTLSNTEIKIDSDTIDLPESVEIDIDDDTVAALQTLNDINIDIEVDEDTAEKLSDLRDAEFNVDVDKIDIPESVDVNIDDENVEALRSLNDMEVNVDSDDVDLLGDSKISLADGPDLKSRLTKIINTNSSILRTLRAGMVSSGTLTKDEMGIEELGDLDGYTPTGGPSPNDDDNDKNTDYNNIEDQINKAQSVAKQLKDFGLPMSPEVEHRRRVNAFDDDAPLGRIGRKVHSLKVMRDINKDRGAQVFDIPDEMPGKAVGLGDIPVDKLRKLKPTMGAIYSTLAALLPIIAASTVQLAGLGVALAGVAGAGAAVGILGALGGEAETLQGSLQSAKSKISKFKKALFQEFEPLADSFAPLFDKAMKAVLDNVGQLSDEIRNFKGFGNFLIGGIPAAISLLEDVFAVFNRLQPEVKALVSTAAAFIQKNLPGFLRALINEGFRAIPTLAKLGRAFINIVKFLYEVSAAVTTFIAQLAPLTYWLGWLAGLLNTRIARGFIKVLGIVTSIFAPLILLSTLFSILGITAAGATGALGSLAFSLSSVVLSAIRNAIMLIPTLIAQVMELSSALATAAGLLSIVTFGVAGLAAGISGVVAMTRGPEISSGTATGGASSIGKSNMTQNKTTNINVYGNPDNSTISDFRSQYERAQGRGKAQNGRFE